MAERSPPATSYRVGVRSRNLELDLVWIASVLAGRRRYPFLPMPSRRKALAALCGLANPASHFDVLSLRDLRPGLAEVPKLVRKFWRKARGA